MLSRVLGKVGIGFAVRVQHKIADVVFDFHSLCHETVDRLAEATGLSADPQSPKSNSSPMKDDFRFL